MRDLIFKGKLVNEEKWVYGYFVEHGDRLWIYTGKMEYVYYPILADKPEKFEVDPETICQYTGVKDTDGNMIFENDILKRDIFGNKVRGVVVWRNIGQTGFSIKVGNKFYPIGKGKLDDDESEECEDLIIGNVLDNPELLEVQE